VSIVSTVSTVSRRYYDKRNRSVAEANIQSMCRALGRPVPAYSELRKLSKPLLVSLAMEHHLDFPNDT